MQVTIPRADLLAAIQPVQRAIERRNTIPILSHLLLDAQDGKLTVRGTNLDIEVTTRADADVKVAGTQAVPAQTLGDIVRKLPEGPILLAMEKERFLVKAGRSRFQLATLHPGDFPDLSVGEMPFRFTLPSETVTKLVAEVSFAISTEETRFYLNGIYLHVTDEHLVAVATDGHRLARLRLPKPEGAEGMPGIIVPRDLVQHMDRLATGEGEAIAVAVSPHKVRLERNTTVIVSKLVDGTFPDYQRVIPAGNDKVVGIEGKALAGAVDRVATVSSERGKAVKLALQGTALTLTMSNPDAGSAEEVVDVAHEGDPIEIGFNARYVSDCLDVLGDGAIELKLDNPGAPALWERKGDDDLLCVLMPMQV